MAIILAGDIGGTKTRLRLVDSQAGATPVDLPWQTTLFEGEYPSHDYPDLYPIVRLFLDTAAQELADSYVTPEVACFGIAGPVEDNVAELTNLTWTLSGERLAREIDVPRVELINDFVAAGYGVVALGDGDLCTLQSGAPDPTAPIAVIGAGTGLGQGFVIPGPDGYRVFPSEGSHADFAPRTDLEIQLMLYLREALNLERVSVERIASGIGITSIYTFLRDRFDEMESDSMKEIYHTWKQQMGRENKTVDLAAEISKAALAEGDYLCEQTMKLFVDVYGVEAGNLALKLLPFGGLFVAGGIAPKILPLIEPGTFLHAFRAKGRMRPLLERVPVHVVLNPKVGLIGAALRAARLVGLTEVAPTARP